MTDEMENQMVQMGQDLINTSNSYSSQRNIICAGNAGRGMTRSVLLETFAQSNRRIIVIDPKGILEHEQLKDMGIGCELLENITSTGGLIYYKTFF